MESTNPVQPGELHRLAETLRNQIQGGLTISPEMIAAWEDRLEPLRTELLPLESGESLQIFSLQGNPTGVLAPRWLHHLLGIPHACAHGLIDYDHPRLGKLFLLQVRDWSKADSPGHLDISFAGHLKGLQSVQKAAWEEMQEEIGLTTDSLTDGLVLYDRYFYREPGDGRNFWNTEWVTLYRGTLRPGALDEIAFEDGEVAGIYLCPEKDMPKLYTSGKWPVAAGLSGYLKVLWGIQPE